MSALLLGQTWALDIPANQRLVLLALADHGEDDGTNIWPSIDLVAWKTGYSESTVRRMIQQMEKAGIISKVSRPGKTNLYAVHIEAGKKKAPFTRKKNPVQTDTPVIAVTPQGLHSSDTPSPVIAVTPEPSLEPSSNHHISVSEETPQSENGKVKPEPTPDDKPKLDWNAFLNTVQDVFGLFGGARLDMANMLLGRSKTGEWKKYNLEQPCTIEELQGYKRWYTQIDSPDLDMVTTPYKVQSKILKYRAWSKMNSQSNNRYDHSTGPAT